MNSKRSFLLIMNLAFFFFCAVPAQSSEDSLVTDIKWQEREGILTYNLSRDGVVKIRAGSFSGPVYRTIVNMVKRAKGQNREEWSGKDEAGKIDFLRYGKAHFCVGLPTQQNADILLNVKFDKDVGLPDTVTVDVEEKSKPAFKKYGGELRIYLDNKLKKIAIVKSLPFTLGLKLDNVSEGKHLLTINLWQSVDFSVVAYSSHELSVPKKIGARQGALNGAIVFCKQDKKGFWQIFTSNLDGMNIKQLTTTPIDKRYPALSHDGKQIAYVNNLGELWIMDSSGKNSRKIATPMRCAEPKFSPDGKTIVFTGLEDVYRGNTKIWQIDLVNSQLTKLVNRPWLQYNPSYSPDGTQVLFTDGPELFQQDIRKLDLRTGDITQLTDNGPYDYDMQASFFNSGEEIVYSTNEGGGDYKIYKMDKFGRDKVKLTQSSEACDTLPTVTRDDSKIFFLRGKNGKFSIWQMDTDGSNEKQVMPDSVETNSFGVYSE